MRRMLSRLTMLAAVLASVGLVAQGSAYASPGAATAAVVGSGTIAPGLTTTPTLQTNVTFTGTAAGGGAAVGGVGAIGTAVGTFSCSFSGSSSSPETVFTGAGVVTGSCTSNPGDVGTGTIACTAAYTRVGVIVVVQLSGCVSTGSGPLGSASSTGGEGVGAFVFAPDQATPPVTSYQLAGESVGVGAS